jgi:ribosomal protein S6--L-glutamate ligase
MKRRSEGLGIEMVLSFHPNIVAQKNILCAGRPPNEEDRAAISQAQAVILPQGSTEALYRMSRKHCPQVFPNYDARFDFPGKLGQIRLFEKVGAAFPRTFPFETVFDYDEYIADKGHNGPWRFPCVFKSDWGGEGEGVSLIKTVEAMQQAIEKARSDEQIGLTGFLLQSYIPSRNRSLRVAVIGDQLFSYWRIQENPSEFLTSLKAGALIDHDAVPELQSAGRDAVRAFCAKTGINLAGFDLLFQQDEKDPVPLFLEINYFFGRQGLGGSLKYYELVDNAVGAWLSRLGLSLTDR